MEFSRSMTKPLMKTGMPTNVVYAVSVRYLYPPCGIAAGTAAACLLALSSDRILLALQRKMKWGRTASRDR
jgi:hypothetical protein